MKQVYIAWVDFQRRNENIKEYFQVELIYFRKIFNLKFLKPIQYMIHAIHTFKLLMKKQPDVVWFQTPPSPVLYPMVFYKMIARKKIILIHDCHHSSLNFPWKSIPFFLKILKMCDLHIYHNDAWFDCIKKRKHVFANWSALLFEDVSPQLTLLPHNSDFEIKLKSPSIVIPSSFNLDEPVLEIFEAALNLPNVYFYFTGNEARAKLNFGLHRIPTNVIFLGYLDERVFNTYLSCCDLILAMTKDENVQLAAAAEGLAVLKPMILSHQEILKKLYNKGSVFADPFSSGAIVKAIQNALKNKEFLTEQQIVLKDERVKLWNDQALAIKSFIIKAQSK